ncbi:hypothetical protein GOP47_0027071 [Adiantum capillus-veneris]|nr:hypothetical protein GOP47_0027071 [Adiantum capillus-veneris]
MLPPSLPTLCLHIMVACIVAFGGTIFHRSELVNVAYAADGASTDSDNMLSENAIQASISRRLAYPDFRDDEKADAITLLGSAEIDKNSGTINIPAISKSKLGFPRSANSHDSPHAISSPQINSTNIQPAPSISSKMAGRALYSFPFRMMDPVSNTTASFHTTFSFRMHKATEMEANTSAVKPNASDSGLTFLVVPDELTVGRNGGWLGLMNDACDEDYKPFAVEFDTFKNEEFQDPNDHHVGINYGSIISHQTADIADAGISLHDGATARAWISYDSSKHLVDVRLAKEGSKKPVEPLLAVPLDLSNIFKEYMFVGFSGGATGNLGHSILSWHFSSDSTGLLRFPKQETCATRLLPSLPTPSRKAPSAFIIFCLVILIIGLAVFNFVCIPYKKKGDEVPTAVKLMKLAREKPRALHKPKKLSISEILEASRLFNEREILGSGNSGIYYRGFLQDSSQVAIKRFSSLYLQQAFNMDSDRRKIEKDVNKLAQVHHPNIVPLRGWCIEKDEVLLVYEYMSNGSLDQWLFSQASTFPWIRRYKIVKELAGALAFLHSSFEKPIVHKNVKLSNVLLDITFRAKLGDYGLSNRVNHMSSMECSISNKSGSNQKVVSPGQSRITHSLNGCMPLLWNKGASFKSLDHVSKGDLSNRSPGSPSKEISAHKMKGCMPQAIMIEPTKREANEVRVLTEEDDVYSYGVMLCEIVCGSMEGEEGDLVDLVEWVWSLQEEGRLAEAIDEDLRFGASRYYTWEEEAASVLTISLLCTLHDPSLRPSMELVTKYLHGEIPIPKVPPRRSMASMGGDHYNGGSLLIYPDLSDDCGTSRYSPPSKNFNLCSPIEFSCLNTFSHGVAP